MLADGIKRDVLFQYDIIIRRTELFLQMVRRIHGQSPKNLLAHAGDTIRRLQQSFSGYIFSDSF